MEGSPFYYYYLKKTSLGVEKERKKYTEQARDCFALVVSFESISYTLFRQSKSEKKKRGKIG